MTVEDLIDELKAHPPTARVEVWNHDEDAEHETAYTPIETNYEFGVVYIHLATRE